jgi:hypothetical protein
MTSEEDIPDAAPSKFVLVVVISSSRILWRWTSRLAKRLAGTAPFI